MLDIACLLGQLRTAFCLALGFNDGEINLDDLLMIGPRKLLALVLVLQPQLGQLAVHLVTHVLDLKLAFVRHFLHCLLNRLFSQRPDDVFELLLGDLRQHFIRAVPLHFKPNFPFVFAFEESNSNQLSSGKLADLLLTLVEGNFLAEIEVHVT